jgi:hypothetical protein
MNKLIYILLLYPAFLLTSCSNEVEIAAPPKETMVIYGLLNTSDSIHYIKINKGFISENTSPIELAKDPDLLFFDSLHVRLINLSSGNSYVLEKQPVQKDSGVFSNAVNYVFSLQEKLHVNDRIRLQVSNPLTGKSVSSETKMLDYPVPVLPSLSTINYLDIEPEKTFRINFNPPRESRSYEIKVHFYYKETDLSSQTSKNKVITWNVASRNYAEQRVISQLDGQLFYDYLSSMLEERPANIQREGLFLEFEYWTTDETFTTYRDVFGTASIGVVQKKTDYTNIEGGYGIFASRNNVKITGTSLSTKTREQLRTNPAMARFNFVN